MNVRPLFAGLGVAAGGAAAIFYLQLREIVDHSWGWYPAEEVHSLTWATGASLLICLLALLIATWPEMRKMTRIANLKTDLVEKKE